MDPRCKDNETRVTNRPFVDAAVQETIAQMPYSIIKDRFDRADLAFAQSTSWPASDLMGISIRST